jgi:hypothetical protein
MRVKSADAILIAAFLSVPLLGAPLMLAIGLEFLRTGLASSSSRVSDALTLLGCLIAHGLALALLACAFSVEYCLLWCLVSLPLNFGFCRAFLVRPA